MDAFEIEKKDQIKQLRKEIQAINKDIPVLKNGEKGAIELDPNNPSHVEWFQGI